MSILVGSETRLCTSGITGREGTFHTLRNRDYGTQIVAGVTPGKGGQDVEGIPIYDTMAEAVAATGGDASFVSVPPKAASAAILGLMIVLAARPPIWVAAMLVVDPRTGITSHPMKYQIEIVRLCAMGITRRGCSER